VRVVALRDGFQYKGLREHVFSGQKPSARGSQLTRFTATVADGTGKACESERGYTNHAASWLR
jgi:hypothetical protein